MSISLIIITRDVGERLALCLAAVNAHEPAAEELIVVLDDPNSARFVLPNIADRRIEHRIVRGRGLGRSAARNDGARAARGEILFFLDGDMLTMPDVIARHRETLATSRGFVRGRVRELLGASICSDLASGGLGFPPSPLSALTVSGFSPRGYRTASNLLEQAVEARFIQGDERIPAWIASAGANFAIARETWVTLGGQEERFGRGWGCEDLEFSYRAAARLGAITFAPDAVGYHLSHPQPARWSDHKRALDLFYSLHPDSPVRALEHLLTTDGSLDRYRAALADHMRSA